MASNIIMDNDQLKSECWWRVVASEIELFEGPEFTRISPDLTKSIANEITSSNVESGSRF